MKKVTAIFLTIVMVVAFTACAKNGESSNTGASDTLLNAPAETLIANEAAEKQENTTVPAKTVSNDESEQKTTESVTGENGQHNDAEPENDNTVSEADSTTNGTNVLVAYFSATNTTEGVAENLADGLGADLYEIIPETPYTDADLNYHDNNSRTTIEMNNPNARPAISGSVENMDQYNIIFLGYPIWWGEAPRIINTFVETYDFNGKTIIPFCTSGGSGMGSSATNLHSATNGATWLDGKRFSGSASVDELVEWANSLGLDF